MYILFDIGGTNIRIGTSKNLSILDDFLIIPTPSSYTEGVSLLRTQMGKMSEGKRIRGIAGGVASPLNSQKSALSNAPNLRDWNGKPLKKNLERALRAPVYLENDTAMIGLGEVHFGAAQKFKKSGVVGYLTVSTGVGGCRFINGKIDTSAFGFEPGHQIIDIDESICSTCACGLCRHGGHAEALFSGSAFEKRFGGKPQDITDAKIWDEAAHLLAATLNNIAVLWSPHAIVIGGGMMKDVGISLSDTKDHLKDLATILPKLPTIQKAKLGEKGGLYGAMAYLKNLD